MKKGFSFPFLLLWSFIALNRAAILDPVTVEYKHVNQVPSAWGPCDPRSIHLYKPRHHKVYVLTFAGWNEERYENAMVMAQRVNDRGYIPLVYTEKDLPPEYYEAFSWAYEKDGYRGFWTWKPWILRNLTDTLLNDGDVLFWIDSDRMIEDVAKLDPKTALPAPYDYFNVIMCNIEHRTHNKEGIFAFRRCYGHVEEHFTKPEIFSIMNVSAEELGPGEQLYAGAIGFKKNTPHTLEFLQKYQDWGQHYPVTFGDESFRWINVTRPEGYKGTRHDQSVFSLMVRSRPEIELWPAPYLAFDSGITKNKCLDQFQNAGYCVLFPDDRFPPDYLTVGCKQFTKWLNNLPATSNS